MQMLMQIDADADADAHAHDAAKKQIAESKKKLLRSTRCTAVY